MTGKSERIVSCTAEEVRERIGRGEGRFCRMEREEALRRRRADPEAPRPHPGWEETITVDLPQPLQQITLRLGADLLRWFRAKGRGYQTLINAVLRGYYEHERGKEPQPYVGRSFGRVLATRDPRARVLGAPGAADPVRGQRL